MACIDVEVDIDIEDHLGEVKDENLIEELESRDYLVVKVGFKKEGFDNFGQQIKALKELLGLQIWHDNKRILREVTELLELI